LNIHITNKMTLYGLSYCELSAETLHRVFSLQLLKFYWCVLVKEFIYRQMTSTNSDVNLVLVNSYKHFFASKLVNTFRLPHKHNFKLLSIWVVINVLSYTFIYLIILYWNINSNSCLEINDIITQSLNLC